MKANNYEVLEAGETIIFRGLVQRSTSQAFFLTFCTLLGMASLALVLQIQFQDLGTCGHHLLLILTWGSHGVVAAFFVGGFIFSFVLS